MPVIAGFVFLSSAQPLIVVMPIFTDGKRAVVRVFIGLCCSLRKFRKAGCSLSQLPPLLGAFLHSFSSREFTKVPQHTREKKTEWDPLDTGADNTLYKCYGVRRLSSQSARLGSQTFSLEFWI